MQSHNAERAHLNIQQAGPGLPDVREPVVALFAAESSSLLAWTDYLLGDRFAQASPLLPERIRFEIARRILNPCLERDSFWWMGLNGAPVNNWNPWICSNWLTSALLVETDEERRRASVAKIFRCLEPLYVATSRQWNGFTIPLVHAMALYNCRAHISSEWYTNFGDAPARVFPDGDLIYRFGKRLGDERIKAHGAFCAFERGDGPVLRDGIGRRLPALFNLGELRGATRTQALFRDSWLPGIQVMTARLREGSAQGVYLAAQGGHNGKSHNHNDVGNFIVYADGAPAIIDVGVETYTAKTFSPQRYDIWTMQSAYHNCPTIDGMMQSAGREFAATEVSYQADDPQAEFSLNLAKAYPESAHLAAWNRVLRLDRARNTVEVVENYRLTEEASVITLTLRTPCAAQVQTGGEITLPMPSGRPIHMEYDRRALHAGVEEIPIEDSRLRQSWGERLYRILLHANAPPLQSTWRLRITQ